MLFRKMKEPIGSGNRELEVILGHGWMDGFEKSLVSVVADLPRLTNNGSNFPWPM